MKKRISAELISIAHRILKLKNHSETVQLQQEAKNLYDQLTPAPARIPSRGKVNKTTKVT